MEEAEEEHKKSVSELKEQHAEQIMVSTWIDRHGLCIQQFPDSLNYREFQRCRSQIIFYEFTFKLKININKNRLVNITA